MDHWSLCPDDVVQRILAHLEDAVDVVMVGRTCRRLHDAANNEEIWQGLCTRRFGDVGYYAALLAEADVNVTAYREEVLSWRLEYVRHVVLLKSTLPSDLEEEYRLVQDMLERIDVEESSESEDMGPQLVKVAERLLHILDIDAEFVPAYYTLSHVCLQTDSLEEANEFLDIVEELQPEFPALKDQRGRIEQRQIDLQGDEANAPLIIDGVLSDEFRTVLDEVFRSYDVDHDGALNLDELGRYIVATNGTEPNKQMLRKLMRSYHSNAKGLTFTGFCEFYRQQTLMDPDETRRDLRALGYNAKLSKTVIASAA